MKLARRTSPDALSQFMLQARSLTSMALHIGSQQLDCDGCAEAQKKEVGEFCRECQDEAAAPVAKFLNEMDKLGNQHYTDQIRMLRKGKR